MLKKIAYGVVALLVVLILLIATRPASFRIERSATVSAPAEIVFAELNDFHEWAKWSPWEKLDAKMQKTYEGPAAGVGSKYHWVGNEQVGEGRMTITDSKPHEHVAIKLEFIKPFAATNDTEFTLKPAADGVGVTWAMSGQNNFMAKAFSLFVNMDEMVGKDFEKGLAELKRISEEEGKRRADEAKKAEAAAPAAAAPAAP